MVDKAQIQKHIALSSGLQLTPNTPDVKAEQARKAKVMEHIQRSLGKR